MTIEEFFPSMFVYYFRFFMRTFLRRFAYLALATIACIALQKFCRSKTDGFAISKISSNLPYNPDFATRPISESELQKVEEILSQPFHYLGKGAQCYAFVSDDDQYVIKFFRLHNLLTPEWFVNMPLPSFLQSYRKEKIQRKFGEFFRDFLSYKIAFDSLQEDTGLIYVHLNKTDVLHKKITLFDKIKIQHSVDLDSMEFLLQKKADLFYPALHKLIQEGKREEVKANVKELIHFLAKRSSLGLYDKDPDINTNFGVCNGKPLQIDVGRFRPDATRTQPDVYISDIIRVTENLQQWLEAQDKDLSDSLIEEIQNLKEKNQACA